MSSGENQNNVASATIDMTLRADSGYQAECIGARITPDQWSIINEVASSHDGVSRRMLDSIYNKHIKSAI